MVCSCLAYFHRTKEDKEELIREPFKAANITTQTVEKFLEDPFTGVNASLVNHSLLSKGCRTVFINSEINFRVLKELASTLGVVLNILVGEESFLSENLVDPKVKPYYAYFVKRAYKAECSFPISHMNPGVQQRRYELTQLDNSIYRADLLEVVLGMLANFKEKRDLKYWEGKSTTVICQSNFHQGDVWLLSAERNTIVFDKVQKDPMAGYSDYLQGKKVFWLGVYRESPLFSNIRT